MSHLEDCWEIKLNLQFKIRIKSYCEINSVSDTALVICIIHEAKTGILRFIENSSSRYDPQIRIFFIVMVNI
jgi:hypothetical protein